MKKIEKMEKTHNKTLRVQQVKSILRRPKKQEQTLIGLGLNKMHKISLIEDTPAIRGMINKIAHLVKVIN